VTLEHGMNPPVSSKPEWQPCSSIVFQEPRFVEY
jgi:hypothetical protein